MAVRWPARRSHVALLEEVHERLGRGVQRDARDGLARQLVGGHQRQQLGQRVVVGAVERRGRSRARAQWPWRRRPVARRAVSGASVTCRPAAASSGSSPAARSPGRAASAPASSRPSGPSSGREAEDGRAADRGGAAVRPVVPSVAATRSVTTSRSSTRPNSSDTRATSVRARATTLPSSRPVRLEVVTPPTSTRPGTWAGERAGGGGPAGGAPPWTTRVPEVLAARSGPAGNVGQTWRAGTAARSRRCPGPTARRAPGGCRRGRRDRRASRRPARWAPSTTGPAPWAPSPPAAGGGSGSTPLHVVARAARRRIGWRR